MTNSREIKIFPNASDLFHFAAQNFAEQAIAAVNKKGNFSVVLSGGDTPKAFFDALTAVPDYKKNIPWQKIQFFFGDERYVSSDDINSNYHMAYEHLFSKVPVNPDNVHRIITEFKDPQEAAKDYEDRLKKIFSIKNDAFPLFDLVYLGLGANAHTASLMPFSEVVKEAIEHRNMQLVAALFAIESNMYRITLTPNTINNSLAIIFLVTGANKATAVSQVLESHPDPLHYPAQLIHCTHGKTLWYLDQAAAEKLSK